MGWPKSLRDLAARREISAREWVVWKKWSGSVEVVIAIRGRWRGFVVFSKLMSRFRSANFMLLIESYVPRMSVISPQLLPSTLNICYKIFHANRCLYTPLNSHTPR